METNTASLTVIGIIAEVDVVRGASVT
jgi:hypothetical protein